MVGDKGFKMVCVSKYQQEEFGCVLDMDGSLYTWGCNSSGQLGHGDFNSRDSL